MGCRRFLFSKLPGNWGIFGKWFAHQQAPEASGGAPGLAIPETGWGWRERCRQEAQDRACQERQFRQALNALRVVNELAMSAHHLLGAEWDLFDSLNTIDKKGYGDPLVEWGSRNGFPHRR